MTAFTDGIIEAKSSKSAEMKDSFSAMCCHDIVHAISRLASIYSQARLFHVSLIICFAIGASAGCQQLEYAEPEVNPSAVRGRDADETVKGNGSGAAARLPVTTGVRVLPASGNARALTIAIAQLSGRARESAAAAARQLAPIMRLGPEHVILFRPPPGLATKRLQDMLATDASVPARVVYGEKSYALLLPGTPMPVISLRMPEILDDRPTAEERNALMQGVAADLNRILANLPDDKPVLVAVAAAVPELSRAAAWSVVHEILAASNRQVTVVIGEDESFSSWQKEGVRYVSVGELEMKGGTPEGEREGRFAGLLWARLNAAAAPSFQVLRLDGMLELSDIQRRDQQTVSKLAATLTATPMDDLSPVTTVRLRNTTSEPLDFTAQWSFEQTEVRVLPQIMGFKLQPGEDYEQQFRFEYNQERSLKAVQPLLALRTSTNASNGDVRPITLIVRPWCRAAALLPNLSDPPALDGISSDWAVPAHSIEYLSQLAGDPSDWHGSRDSSAELRVAWHADDLWIGIRVTDDLRVGASGMRRTVGERCLVYMYSGDSQPLGIAVLSDGRYEFLLPNESPGEPAIATVADDNGYGAEIRVPGRLLVQDSVEVGVVRLDVVITDVDGAGDAPKRLVFSGRLNSDGVPVRELYGRFVRETPDADEPAVAE